MSAASNAEWHVIPNYFVNRTRNGMPRLGLISFWPKRVLPLRAGYRERCYGFFVSFGQTRPSAITDVIDNPLPDGERDGALGCHP